MIPHTIRPARQGDLPQLHALIKALSAYHGDVATVTLQETQALFFDRGAPARAFLAETTTAGVIGYAAVVERVRLHTGERALDVQQLYVRERFRSQGVGRSLVAAAVAEGRARGCAGLSIGTHPNNRGAQAAYRVMGLDEAAPIGPRFRLAL